MIAGAQQACSDDHGTLRSCIETCANGYSGEQGLSFRSTVRVLDRAPN